LNIMGVSLAAAAARGQSWSRPINVNYGRFVVNEKEGQI